MVITGNGKGKTTSAIGAGVRAVGDGRRVLMIQFIKGPWRSGEDDAQLLMATLFKIVKTDAGSARQGLEFARDAMRSGRWDMLILDEINNAVNLGLVEESDVCSLVDEVPDGMDVILTGRDARRSLIDRADIVSDIVAIKHP